VLFPKERQPVARR